MEWNFSSEEKKHLRPYLRPLYAGPVLDAVAGLRQNTRQGWRTRGFFTTTDGDYCFLDLLLGTTRKRLLRHGIMPPSAKSPILMRIVLEMLARAEGGKLDDAGPSWLVNGPASGVPTAVEEQRTAAGFRGAPGVYTYTDGHGAMVIMAGLTTAEVAEYVTGLDATVADSVFAVDVAKVLRTTVAKLREVGQPVPGEEPKP